MTKVKCNFCFEEMEENEFVDHLKEDHAIEVIEDAMTNSTLMGYSIKVK